MNLTRMMTDKVFLEDKNGARTGPYKTKFGSKRITIFQDELHVNEGDRVIQPLADGTERVYVADVVSFNSARRNVPAHYTLVITHAVTTATLGVAHLSGAPKVVRDVPDDLNNKGSIAEAMAVLANEIENANFPTEQKDAAMCLLRQLASHPVVIAIVDERGASQLA